MPDYNLNGNKLTFNSDITEIDRKMTINLDKEVIEEVDLANVRRIIGNVFSSFSKLKKLKGEYLEQIGVSAFSFCKNLEEIDLKNIKIIESKAFVNCKKLERIDLSNIVELNSSVFNNCGNLKEVKLPNSLNKIKENTFNLCINLTDINLGHVESFGQWAFANCKSLENIDLSSAVSIETNAFCDCTGLKTLDLCKAEIIKENAFYGCSNLSNVTLGNLNGVPDEISGRDFKSKNNSTSPQIEESAFYRCAIPWKKDFLNNIGRFTNETTFVFKQNVKKISKALEFFNSCKKTLKVVDLGNIEEIPSQFFEEFEELEEINGKKLQKIGACAFKNCKNLKSVIGKNITTIGDGAFFGAANLKTINLSNIESICENSISDCKIIVDKINENLSSNEFSDIVKVYYAKDQCRAVLEKVSTEGAYKIKDSLKSLPETWSPVKPLENVTELDFNNVEVLPPMDYAKIFPNLKRVRGKNVNGFCYGQGNFRNLQTLTEVDFRNFDCQQEALLPTLAFGGDKKLEKVNVGKCSEVGNGAFSGCTSLKEMSLKACTVIGEKAFMQCQSLEKILICNCKELGVAAFYDCKNLEKIELDNCTKIGNMAFFNCTKLKHVTIRTKQKLEIGKDVFRNCKNLKLNDKACLELSPENESLRDILCSENNIEDKGIYTTDANFDGENDVIYSARDNDGFLGSVGGAITRAKNQPTYKFENFSEPLFPNNEKPMAKDIAQGYIGDCWLLAALSSIAASDPAAIVNAFTEKDPKKNFVVIKLYKVKYIKDENRYIPNGAVYIRIDRSIPTDKALFGLLKKLFGNANYDALWTKNALWVKLLEKAFAVYVKDEKGFGPGEEILIKMRNDLSKALNKTTVMTAITGKPTKSKNIRSDSEVTCNSIFKSISQRVNAKKAIIASLLEDKEIKGLLPGKHAYAIVGVVENGKLRTVDSDSQNSSKKELGEIKKFLTDTFMNKFSIKSSNKYVVVRNPHAGVGVFFEENVEEPKKVSTAQGFSIIEISQFCARFHNILYTANKDVGKIK